MDVNQTRFHLLLGRRDWTALFPDVADPAQATVVWQPAGQHVSLKPLLFRFDPPEGDDAFEPACRRGAGRDQYGNWYSLHTRPRPSDTPCQDQPESFRIDFLPLDHTQAQRFWPPEESQDCTPPDKTDGAFTPAPAPKPAPQPLRGLAVTTHHYLVVGTLNPGGLLIFDLHAGGPPIRVTWPLPFAPFDITPRPEGGVWILDADPASPNTPARLWALDRYFRIEGREQPKHVLTPADHPLFQPKAGPARPSHPARLFPGGLALQDATLPPGCYPIAIEGLPDDSLLLLEAADGCQPRLSRYVFSQRIGPPVMLRTLLQDQLANSKDPLDTWTPYDLAFVPGTDGPDGILTGTLHLVGQDGNQAFAFALSADLNGLTLALLNRYLPLRRFGGKALVAAGSQVFYDLGDRWLPLTERPRPRFRTEGQLVVKPDHPLDGQVPSCVWHRLFLDACIPPGTQVVVESRAANSQTQLQELPWQREPDLYLRATGPEIPYYTPFDDDDRRRTGTGTWELLFQAARGRYLQLRLSLRGTGRSSPRLFALRAYYPRFSYLQQYLPDVYQQDPTSAAFLDRFLANAEGLFTEIEGRVAEAQTLLDPRTLQPAFLDWLAGWLGVVLDPDFDVPRRRLFIQHAITLFNQRGTLAGLIRTLRLATDPCPDKTLFEDHAIACNLGQVQACAHHPSAGRHGLRMVEQYRTRALPGVHFGDPTDLLPPRTTHTRSSWSPVEGATPLHQRYRAYLQARYDEVEALNAAWDTSHDTFSTILLPPVPPQQPSQWADWHAFLKQGLGFPYAAPRPEDVARYRTLLARRYGSIAALNRAYIRNYNDFCDLSLPGVNDFPAQGPLLKDWIDFVSQALPIHRHAHRFVVLVPMTPGEPLDKQSRRLALVQRIVEHGKPAHTHVEVKPYWAVFQTGAVRLGLDTRLEASSRYVALQLGRTPLASGYLAATHPWDVPDRIVLGRDLPGPDMTL